MKTDEFIWQMARARERPPAQAFGQSVRLVASAGQRLERGAKRNVVAAGVIKKLLGLRLLLVEGSNRAHHFIQALFHSTREIVCAADG